MIDHGEWPDRVIERVSALGEVGKSLARWLDVEDCKIDSLPVDKQIVFVNTMVARGLDMRAAACSVLVCDCPVQVLLDKSCVCALVSNVLYTKCGHGIGLCEKGVCHKPKGVPGGLKRDSGAGRVFPVKSHPGATNSVNIYWDDVWLDTVQHCNNIAKRFSFEDWRLGGLYDDQAVALVMYAAGLGGVFSDAVEYATGLARNADVAKALTNVIKALGINGMVHGALLCEANTLQGRGVTTCDLANEVKFRTTAAGVAGKVAKKFDRDTLRAAIAQVIDMELKGREVEFDDLDTFWSKRWLWCVNGAHSRVLEKASRKYILEVPGRMHRRVFVENLDEEPITQWDGVAYYSASEKLENGKSRALFAADSVSYVAFEHLLKPVEQAWRGIKVVLDPGSPGHLGMVKRQRKLRAGAGINLMLDYDDFNSHHSLDSMIMVFEELCKAVEYPDHLAAKLFKSLRNGLISYDGTLRPILGTLMSGHRATTFLNSVLNIAYLMAADPRFFGMRTMHVGDDVYVACESHAEAARLLGNIAESDLRMNAMKQSVGAYTAEFLRVATGPRASYGYLARSISACVEGNWVNAMKLSEVEALATMVQHAWTLKNRSVTGGCEKLLVRAICRVTGLKAKTAERLCDGTLALGNGPVRRRDNCYERLVVSVARDVEDQSRDEVLSEVRLLGGKTYAVEAYLEEHVSPVEVSALVSLGTSVAGVMTEASYSKSLSCASRFAQATSGLRAVRRSTFVTCSAAAEDLVKAKPYVGELDKYPMLQLIKNRLTVKIVRELLALEGVAPGEDAWRTAFSERAHGGAVDGIMSYTDASTLLGRTDVGIVSCRDPMYV